MFNLKNDVPPLLVPSLQTLKVNTVVAEGLTCASHLCSGSLPSFCHMAGNLPLTNTILRPRPLISLGDVIKPLSSIARSIETCMKLTVPNISIIIGEGGSGGAIALASSNKVVMLENAIYSVISPEGCATILWRDPKKMLDAAKAMKLSAKDLLDLNVIDEIIPEPLGDLHFWSVCAQHSEVCHSHSQRDQRLVSLTRCRIFNIRACNRAH